MAWPSKGQTSLHTRNTHNSIFSKARLLQDYWTVKMVFTAQVQLRPSARVSSLFFLAGSWLSPSLDYLLLCKGTTLFLDPATQKLWLSVFVWLNYSKALADSRVPSICMYLTLPMIVCPGDRLISLQYYIRVGERGKGENEGKSIKVLEWCCEKMNMKSLSESW